MEQNKIIATVNITENGECYFSFIDREKIYTGIVNPTTELGKESVAYGVCLNFLPLNKKQNGKRN